MDRDPFVDYYEKQSASAEMVEHFHRLRDLLLSAMRGRVADGPLRVADIGCGAGAFSAVMAQAGCVVEGIDINEPLVRIAGERAKAANLPITFHNGSAESLPWPDGSFDIVAMPELLEHVPGWKACLAEAARVLRSEGVLYVSTTNRLCPVQQEFSLLLYSWYPGWLKQRCVAMAKTTHREWVNHAIFPAVNWFDPYSLGSTMRKLGLVPIDRFAMWAQFSSDLKKQRVGRAIGVIAPLRLFGHVISPGTMLIGRKI
ncbi:MAG: class I SAM-dependent methyltransferase [Steroidobacteraceae bacterium]